MYATNKPESKSCFDDVTSTAQLYREAEYQANFSNERCLLIVSCFVLLAVLLNEVHIFVVDRTVMNIGCMASLLFFVFPKLCSITAKKLTHGRYIPEQHSWFKYAIVTFSFLGVMVANIVLTHQTLLVLALPYFVMAQYRDVRHLLPLGVVLSALCVLAGVYLGFFFGLLDSNLVGVAFPNDDEVVDLAYRLRLATPLRMRELFSHYVMPREIIMLALLVLSYATTARNNQLIAKQAALRQDVEREMAHTNRMQAQVIVGMATMIENRDFSTGEHVKRTSTYVRMIAQELVKENRLSAAEAENIEKAAPLHDVGKIAVSDRVLQKPGKLTPEEYAEIKRHSAEGEKMIWTMFGGMENEQFLHIAAEIAGCHHERWDGAGYPNGLAGSDIPLAARIMAIADVFDALISKRIYKDAYPPEKAFQIISEGAGSQFDPDLVRIFLSMKSRVLACIQQS